MYFGWCTRKRACVTPADFSAHALIRIRFGRVELYCDTADRGVPDEWISGRATLLPRGRGSPRYVGRTSLITEYIGSSMLRAAIRFLPPSTYGLTADEDAVPVCARLGSTDVPVDAGWFVHHIRSTGDGSEMRSRFWIGGPHIAVRSGP